MRVLRAGSERVAVLQLGLNRALDDDDLVSVLAHQHLTALLIARLHSSTLYPRSRERLPHSLQCRVLTSSWVPFSFGRPHAGHTPSSAQARARRAATTSTFAASS